YPDQPSFGLGGWGGLSQDTQTIQFVSDFEEEVRDGVVTGTYERKHVRVQLTGHLSSRSEVWSSDQSLFFSDTFRYLNEEFDELGQLTRRTKTDTKNASFSGPTLLDWSQVPMPSEISPFQ